MTGSSRHLLTRRKATKVETAEKIYKREKRRFQRQQERINRANGFEVSPPRVDDLLGSMSPPRRRQRSAQTVSPGPQAPGKTGKTASEAILVDSDDEAGPSSSGTHPGGRRANGTSSWARSARPGMHDDAIDDTAAREREREAEERLRWMMEEQLRDDPFDSSAFGGAGGTGVGWGYVQPTPDTAVPARHRSTNGAGPSTANGHRPTRTDAIGGVPNMAGMTNEEYASFVRESFERRKALEERDILDAQRAEAQKRAYERLLADEAAQEAEEAARRKRLKKEHRERKAREKAAQEEQERAERAEMERARRAQGHSGPDIWVFDDFKKSTREHYRARWTAITNVGGEVEETRIGFNDIPWPVYYTTKGLDKAKIREFMADLAKEAGVEVKKVLREGIRQFHPDRFFGRILPRTREDERDKVREGVENCTRAINDLLAEAR